MGIRKHVVMTGSWLRYVCARVTGSIIALSVIAFVALMMWLIWRGNAQAPALMFTAVAAGQAGTFVYIADARPIRLKKFSVSVDLRDFAQELLLGTVVLLGAWAIIGVTFANEHVVHWLDRNFHKTDPDLLLTCEIVFIVSIGLLVLEALSRRGVWLGLRSGKRGGDAIVMHEAAWLLGLILIALLPATFFSSWLPNVLAGVALPILVLYLRDNFHKFEKERSRVDTEPSSDHGSEEAEGGTGQGVDQVRKTFGNRVAELVTGGETVAVVTFKRRPRVLWPLKLIRFLGWLANTFLIVSLWLGLIILAFMIFDIVTTYSGDPRAPVNLQGAVDQVQIYISCTFAYIIFMRIFSSVMMRFAQGPGPTQATRILRIAKSK